MFDGSEQLYNEFFQLAVTLWFTHHFLERNTHPPKKSATPRPKRKKTRDARLQEVGSEPSPVDPKEFGSARRRRLAQSLLHGGGCVPWTAEGCGLREKNIEKDVIC